MKVKRICQQCGKYFFVVPSILKKKGGGKYCSQECVRIAKRGINSPYWKGNKIKRICKICGKEFFVWPYVIKRGQGKYCSNECQNKSRQKRMIRECKQCGKRFEVKLTEINRGGGKYCSDNCFYKSRNKKIIQKCGWCGEEFEVTPSRIKYGGGKYCSIKCRDKSQDKKIERKCEICGKEFKTIPSRAKVGFGKYCSTECHGKAILGENSPAWKGGTSFFPYCPKFNERRKKAVRDFFNNTCLACGKLSSENVVGKKGVINLPVHHADHDKDQGCNGKPFNLVPLCNECHGKELWNEEEYCQYINKTLREGFKWGIWNEEEYIRQVMYPDN